MWLCMSMSEPALRPPAGVAEFKSSKSDDDTQYGRVAGCVSVVLHHLQDRSWTLFQEAAAMASTVT